MGALLLAVVFVVAVGLPAAWAAAPRFAVALPLSGVTSGLTLAFASVAAVLTSTALLPWVVAATATTWLGAVVLWRRRGSRRGSSPSDPPWRRSLAVVALGSAPVLLGSLGPATDYDARAIWYFHARWLWEGGATTRGAMANAALGFSHSDYPPLVPATAAGLWSVVGGGDLQLAQAVVSVQAWATVVLVGMLVAGVVGRRAALPVAAVAALFAVACFGVAGGFGTRGYADLTWAAMAAAAAVAGLVLPPDRMAVRVTALAVAGAVLTKSEGLVSVAGVLVPLITLRWALLDRRRLVRRLVVVAPAVAVGLAWPVLTALLHTDSVRDITGAGLLDLLRGEPARMDRVGPAIDGLWAYARTTTVAVAAVAALGALVVRGDRRHRRLGGGAWLPVAAAGCAAVALVALAAGELDVHFWLVAAGFRLMTVVRCLLLTEVLVLAAVAVDVLLDPATSLDAGGAGAATQPAPVEQPTASRQR